LAQFVTPGIGVGRFQKKLLNIKVDTMGQDNNKKDSGNDSGKSESEKINGVNEKKKRGKINH